MTAPLGGELDIIHAAVEAAGYQISIATVSYWEASRQIDIHLRTRPGPAAARAVFAALGVDDPIEGEYPGDSELVPVTASVPGLTARVCVICVAGGPE